MNSIRLIILGCFLSVVCCSVSAAQNEQQSENPPAEKAFLGVQFKMAPDRNGAQIVTTLEGFPAGSKLRAGDVILKFEDSAITEKQQLRDMTLNRKPGDVVEFTIWRDDKEIVANVELFKRPTNLQISQRGDSKKSDFSTTTFKSEDGLPITADVYEETQGDNLPVIVLCHQAGWSRGEYREIAPKLNKLGFNCIAIDQRSGGAVNDIVNETNQKAQAEGKETNFTDAEQDMIATLKWARKQNPDSKVILWGSSYSSALALRIAGENPDLVDGVLAFAPGEYFVRFGKPKDWITSSAEKIQDPAFITSAKNEAPKWKAIFDAIPGDSKSKFVPETKGNHGSRALWEKFEDNGQYWSSVKGFLAQFK